MALPAIALCACSHSEDNEQQQSVTGGDPKVGQHLIYAYGCGTCHAIPGIAAANGIVGPALQGFGSRIYFAGLLANPPDNLFRWVSKPQDVDPTTAMPA